LFTRTERFISYRNLKPKKKEGFLKVISIFSFSGIALGVAILIIVMSVMNGFRTDLTNKILGLNPHIIVQPNGAEISNNFKKKLKKYKNFKILNTFNGEGIVISKDNAKGIMVKGLDLEITNNLFIKNYIIEGNYNDLKKGSALIGAELAYNLELGLGDKINLMSSTFINTPFGGVPNQQYFEIKGIFNSGFQDYDQNLIFLDLNDALSIFDKNTKDINLEIYLQEPLEADLYKKELQDLDENLFIYSWSDLNKSFFSALKVERNVMFIILTLIIIVAAFNIISGLTILIKNKTKEIAILKTLGLSNYSIKKTFFLTGFIIGFLATITGIFLGIIFSIYIEEIRIFFSAVFGMNIFPSDVYFLEKMPSEINFLSIIIIFIFSIIITCLASLLPTISISKMELLKSLKYD
jgi:lipoprotein-releasing system permease protein